MEMLISIGNNRGAWFQIDRKNCAQEKSVKSNSNRIHVTDYVSFTHRKVQRHHNKPLTYCL